MAVLFLQPHDQPPLSVDLLLIVNAVLNGIFHNRLQKEVRHGISEKRLIKLILCVEAVFMSHALKLHIRFHIFQFASHGGNLFSSI